MGCRYTADKARVTSKAAAISTCPREEKPVALFLNRRAAREEDQGTLSQISLNRRWRERNAQQRLQRPINCKIMSNKQQQKTREEQQGAGQGERERKRLVLQGRWDLDARSPPRSNLGGTGCKPHDHTAASSEWPPHPPTKTSSNKPGSYPWPLVTRTRPRSSPLLSSNAVPTRPLQGEGPDQESNVHPANSRFSRNRGVFDLKALPLLPLLFLLRIMEVRAGREKRSKSCSLVG